MENMIISNDENMRSPKHEMLKYGDMEIWRNPRTKSPKTKSPGTKDLKTNN